MSTGLQIADNESDTIVASSNGLKILAWILVVFLLLIAAYISRFLIGTIMLGILLAYMLTPIHNLALMKTKSKRWAPLIAMSALLLSAALIVLVLYRTASLGLAGFFADAALPANMTANIATEKLWTGLGDLSDLNQSAGLYDSKLILQAGIIPFLTSFIIPAIIQDIVNVWIVPLLESGMLNFALGFPVFLIQLTVASFFAYYLLLNGKDAALRSPDLLPERQRTIGRHFLNELDGVFKTLFMTNFDIAAYNALVGIIVFSLIGVPFAAVWAIIAAFLSLTRFLGPWLIFVPLSLILFSANDVSKGFLVLLFGFTLLEYVPEYILRPRVSEGSSQVNSALAFLSYVSPIFVLGLLGIIIGPFVYGLLIAAYRTALHFNEKREDLQKKEMLSS